ncbi:MAG: aldehyde dehydrogenase family protein [Betaproteobacteria bacterium]|nr:aldehyde dehydrogenase family protein [Betaproteobacteria bacterium]
MEFAPEGPKAIPLWIDGRAYLTVVDSFFDVIAPASGEALRRVPLCGAAEAGAATAAARAAAPGWQAAGANERAALLAALADGLDRYTGHFARLLGEECGIAEADAQAEVAAAVAALRGGAAATAGTVAVVVDASRPLARFATLAAPLLRAGATLVVKPSPRAPAAVAALCELTARTGWPAGVVNVLHGDSEAIKGLCAAGVDRLAFAGGDELGVQVGALAAAAGVPFAVAA